MDRRRNEDDSPEVEIDFGDDQSIEVTKTMSHMALELCLPETTDDVRSPGSSSPTLGNPENGSTVSSEPLLNPRTHDAVNKAMSMVRVHIRRHEQSENGSPNRAMSEFRVDCEDHGETQRLSEKKTDSYQDSTSIIPDVLASTSLDAKTDQILEEAKLACSKGVHLKLQQRIPQSIESLETSSTVSDTGVYASDMKARTNRILKEAHAAVSTKKTTAPPKHNRKSPGRASKTSSLPSSPSLGPILTSTSSSTPITTNKRALSTDNEPTSDALEDFLILAEQRSMKAAAEAIRDVGHKPKIRSTKDVLKLASGVLKPANVETEASSNAPSGNLEVATTSRHYYNHNTLLNNPRANYQHPEEVERCLSPSDSDIASIEDYEKAVGRLPSKVTKSDTLSREKILKQIDGMPSPHHHQYQQQPKSFRTISADHSSDSDSVVAPVKRVVVQEVTARSSQRRSLMEHHEPGTFSFLNYLWGSGKMPKKGDNLDIINPISCGPVSQRLPAMANSLVRVKSDDTGFAETVNKMHVDPRMPDWFQNQLVIQDELPQGTVYHLGDSKTVIVHEIQRGDWTWCTAWSPDGKRLAMATENHHLAVVDTSSSAVWRVHHDKKIKGPKKKGTTHAVRCIAWGAQFIAIGGTGDAVSILAPTEPYPVLHTISSTGFVGTMDWLQGSNTLVIGSRSGKATIVNVWAHDDTAPKTPFNRRSKEIDSTEIRLIDRGSTWVNAVKFSPGGHALAVGDSDGILSIYSYEGKHAAAVKMSNIANFKLDDSILSVDWSSDGQWVYSGGEDFAVTIVNTKFWEAVHRIKRDRWVQFISSSSSGTHVAVGGVSSEVSILEVEKGWDTILNIGLKGLVPLSAQWHPQDQYLVLTGQDNSVHAVETTNARYVTGHFLRSLNPILAVEFSPDGRMAAIGNEAGVVTIFKLSGLTFISCYEIVLDCDGSLSIVWNKNGAFLSIVSGTKLIIVSKTKSADLADTAPPNTSGFYVSKVLRGLGNVHAVAIHPQGKYMAVCGDKKTILDMSAGFECVREWTSEETGKTLACAWSHDGTWLATVGQQQPFTVFDTTSANLEEWRAVFTVERESSGLALAWGPPVARGLQYCAFGGEERDVTIMEIRSIERTWEIILVVPREGVVHDLDWSNDGLLAAAVGNGTVTVMDTSYLQSGWAVNEMDYTWQRQALTCFTEIRRNRGVNSMRAVKWIPSAPGSDTLLACGGTDGEIEIIDLTERQRCSGFNKVTSAI